jgi:hypothetical protein
MLATQQAAQLRAGRNPLSFLRTEFWHDQLGYLAISANVANGHFDLTEPVTMTGVNHYPRLYYSMVGIIARTLGLPTVTAWNLASFALQFLAAFTVGMVAAHLSRRWWVGVLAPMPFLTGVFAYASQAGSWYTLLKAHAVLWGPFGVLFSNNAETAGVCIGIIVLGCLVWAWNAEIPRAARNAVTIAGAASVGALSSFQTYSFLTMTYLLAFGAAVAGVYLSRRRVLALGVSLALVAVVFVVGPLLAERVGQLPTLIFGILPALPGLMTAVIRSRGIVAYAGVAAVAAAAPQVLYTLSGMVQGDPFLTYRVASNNQLGIVSWQALWGASVVLVALIAAFAIGIKVKDSLTVVTSGAGLTALPLLAVNDLWGANAEPYRFWIEAILLGGVLSMFALARLCGLLLTPRGQAAPTGEDPAERKPRSARKLIVGSLIVVGILWTASIPDWVNSLRDPAMQAVWNPATQRETAIAELARKATLDAASGLLTTELCIDNRTAKVNSGSPISNYHLGMAWPAEREAIDEIIGARDAGELDFDAMRDSGTRWVLTDSNCTSDWESIYAAGLTAVESRDYDLADGEVISAGSQGSGTITLWQVAAQP